ncbi:methyltransferase domain-containing protein [Actinomycetospora cinnamomea]|uniref:Ubiquinone/menaquinone biosynthesis C-methylase UbiE n=1 Tax=Actinomycetospora cinnamomea TaxID=663609 RepID=A0A2U1EAU9_9PSEU|nr:methyltransferase domain-containing protein [Actinomycetospora cinnamomea]PVY97071.1 ubiquinone/menaquinone biosynthesis C-methylase UbiE [Actinomycetospora cinnamomea]
MSTLPFDDEGARRIQRVYSTPDVAGQREQVLALLRPARGEHVLDVGSGPGFLAAAIADAVGPDGAVRGLDPSPAMNAVAAAHCADRPWVAVEEGGAEALPYPDGHFDAVVSTQVYEYVPDVLGALVEARRVLRPGGRIVVLDTDWESVVWHAADRDLQRRVLDAWEEHLVHPRLPRVLPGLMERAGFDVVERVLIPLFNPVHDDDTYSVRTIEVIGDFVTGRRGLTEHDVARWADDLHSRGTDYLFSVNRYCFVGVAPG